MTLARLLEIFTPLALSWLMMSTDTPICTGFVNLLPDQRVQIASFLALFSIALFIESPVIDLLSTSATLARSAQSYAAIRKFTVWLMVLTGVVHLLVAVTPLFDVVFGRILNLRPDVVEATRIPMLILLPWSPAIGWRRHVQGLLIRSGVTTGIGFGTLVRVVTIFLTALLGFLSKALTGAEVAALAMAVSVTSEAVYIHFVGKRALARMPLTEDGEILTTGKLIEFHLPLTLSTMVMLTSFPLTISALARSPDGILAMNSWQVSISLAFLLRTITFALPEVVITNWNEGRDSKLLARFSLGIGGALSALMLILGAFGIDELFFRYVTQADAVVAHGAHNAFLACSALPLLSAAGSYTKGILTAMRVTVARLAATLVGVVVLGAVLFFGVGFKWPGVVTAASAVTLSLVAELGILIVMIWARTTKSLRRQEKSA